MAEESLTRLKCATLEEARMNAICVSTTDSLRLVPVGSWITSHGDLIEDLARWRGVNSEMFFARFPQSASGMRQYLKSTSIANPETLLFLIELNGYGFVGHVGLKNFRNGYAEVDSIMRSPEVHLAGMVDKAFKALLRFTEQFLGIESLSLEVISYNNSAIKLYLRHGFSEVSRTPLSQVIQGGLSHHIRVTPECANVEYSAITMRRDAHQILKGQGVNQTLGRPR